MLLFALQQDGFSHHRHFGRSDGPGDGRANSRREGGHASTSIPPRRMAGEIEMLSSFLHNPFLGQLRSARSISDEMDYLSPLENDDSSYDSLPLLEPLPRSRPGNVPHDVVGERVYEIHRAEGVVE
jgi:hypothetical protein